jgi:hypothetical protein
VSAIRFSCRSDFGAYCKGVQPVGLEAFACLQRNAARLDPNCQAALADAADDLPAASAAAPATAPATAPAARPMMPPGMTPAGRVMRRVIERNAQQ